MYEPTPLPISAQDPMAARPRENSGDPYGVSPAQLPFVPLRPIVVPGRRSRLDELLLRGADSGSDQRARGDAEAAQVGVADAAAERPIHSAALSLATQRAFDTVREAWSDAPPRSVRDRRAFPRRESGSVALVGRLGEKTTFAPHRTDWLIHAARLKGDLVDLGLGGAAFLSPEPIPIGDRVLLQLRNPILNRQLDVPARVLRCQAEDDGRYKTVCGFLKKLGFEQATDFTRQLSRTFCI